MKETDIKEISKYITVVGAVNIDICGTPYQSLRNSDSNPGRMTVSFGGVGRNIADNISRLGGNVELITVLGDDLYASEIEKSCTGLGIGLRHAVKIRGERTSTYLCINDENGDMVIALSDMDIYGKLTPEYLEDKIPFINNGKLLVIDANLSDRSIEYLANNCTVPILAEPVSTIKASRFKNILNKIFLLKPNLLELEILSSVKINNRDDLNRASDILLNKGVENVVTSMGRDGVYHASKESKIHYPCFPCKVVNSTGCGDSLMGGISWALQNDEPISKAIEYGLAAASICIETIDTISKELTKENLFKRIKEKL